MLSYSREVEAADRDFVNTEQTLKNQRKLKALEENEARWKAFTSHVSLLKEAKLAEKL